LREGPVVIVTNDEAVIAKTLAYLESSGFLGKSI
jgi:hypothetical protein